MSLDSRPDESPEIGGVDDLVELFRATEKHVEDFRIGMEHEKIGLLADSLAPLPYRGERSIEAVFAELIEKFGFEPFREGEDVIALKKSGTHVSLEPGGQLELSGAVLRDIFETCHELSEHRDLTHAIGDDLGIVWLGVGHRPFASKEQVEWVPKKRYEIMRAYMPTVGTMGLDMMLQTGTVQANFDYESEPDLIAKMRAAMAVTPLVSAIYANSSIVGGEDVGWASWRQRIWQDVDPDRSGLLHFVFDDDFGYRRYVEWTLDVPMYFIRRDGKYVPGITGTPFRTFLAEGFEGHRARLSDWEDHLTTLFPEVRAKGYLEVRGADCCDRELNCALPALWKGILYDPGACEAAFELGRDWTREERETLLHDVARLGLQAEIRGTAVLDLARELVAIARAGLDRRPPDHHPNVSEARFLEPISRVLEEDRKSPGRVAAERWTGDLGRDPRKLIEHYRF